MERFEFDIEKQNKEIIKKRAKANRRSARQEANVFLNDLIGNWQNQVEITEKTFKKRTMPRIKKSEL